MVLVGLTNKRLDYIKAYNLNKHNADRNTRPAGGYDSGVNDKYVDYGEDNLMLFSQGSDFIFYEVYVNNLPCFIYDQLRDRLCGIFVIGIQLVWVRAEVLSEQKTFRVIPRL
jgi:hypothetical protein